MIKKILQKVRTVYYCCRYKIKHGKNCSIGRRFKVPDRAHIVFGDNVTIYPDCIFDGEGEIKIGDRTTIGTSCQILSYKDSLIEIGSDVMIGRNSYLINANHGIENCGVPINAQRPVSGNIFIGNDVWIGAYCMVIKGAKINDGCVLGAKALLNKEMPSYSIFGGVPAAFIKNR